MVASVTADNLMFMLRAKSAEARAEAAAAEAAQLRAAALEGRDPWLAQVQIFLYRDVLVALPKALPPGPAKEVDQRHIAV